MGSWIWRTLLECMIVQLMIPPVAIQALQPCSQLISHHLSPSCLAQKTIRRLLTPEYFYCKTWVFSNSVKFKSMNNCTLWNKWYRNRCSKHAFTYQQHLKKTENDIRLDFIIKILVLSAAWKECKHVFKNINTTYRVKAYIFV